MRFGSTLSTYSTRKIPLFLSHWTFNRFPMEHKNFLLFVFPIFPLTDSLSERLNDEGKHGKNLLIFIPVNLVAFSFWIAFMVEESFENSWRMLIMEASFKGEGEIGIFRVSDALNFSIFLDFFLWFLQFFIAFFIIF